EIFITVMEGEELVIRPYATDADGDKVRYWYSGFSDSSTRYVDYGEAGVYSLVVHATDGKIFSSYNITVLVEKTNRPPVIESPDEIAADEGETISFNVNAYDTDGDDIVYLVAENMPEGATFINNLFQWTPGFGTVNNEKKEFIIEFYAADYNLTSEKIVRITVNNKNRAPIVVNATPEHEIKVYEGDMVTFKVNAFDYENDTITYKWKFGTFETYTDGNIHSRVFTIPGRKNVDVIVSDGIEQASYRWIVDVFERTTAPQQEEQVFKRYIIEG
ncbi:MAG: PKD domain-containing protein, partial [Candidatus Nanoarchaeia archaeon]|nr:PKD domain-containing protein [Candidatus Nanoarchaeia archaeon]